MMPGTQPLNLSSPHSLPSPGGFSFPITTTHRPPQSFTVPATNARDAPFVDNHQPPQPTLLQRPNGPRSSRNPPKSVTHRTPDLPPNS